MLTAIAWTVIGFTALIFIVIMSQGGTNQSMSPRKHLEWWEKQDDIQADQDES